MNLNELLLALSGVAINWTRLPENGTPARFIHRTMVRQVWAERSFVARLVLASGFVIWIPVMFGCLIACICRMGPEVKRLSGIGLGRQIREQISLLMTTFIPPPWYYIFELYEKKNRDRALDYLYPFETKRGVFRFLRSYLTSRDTVEGLSDKATFTDICSRFGLRAIPAIGIASKGNYRHLEPHASSLPKTDLFVKPLRGGGGKLAELWIHESSAWRGPDGKVLESDQLIEDLRRRSRARPWVVRPRVTNHPDLENLGCGALSTVRVLTCLDEAGRPEITHAAFKMAREFGSIVDNAHAGGIAAPVDLWSGELGMSTDMGVFRKSGWWASHPTTGAPIVGRKLPAWGSVVELALAAHRAFPDQVMIGWDIALLADGPTLVEGNKAPGLDLMQRVHQEPLGTSRFGELLAFHLHRALSKKYRQI